MTGIRRRCMISIDQIDGEIAVLEEEKPTHVIMQKLANLYTVRDHMTLDTQPVVSNSVNLVIPPIGTDTEFADITEGKSVSKVFSIMDELMTTLKVVNPNLYASVIRKLP